MKKLAFEKLHYLSQSYSYKIVESGFETMSSAFQRYDSVMLPLAYPGHVLNI